MKTDIDVLIVGAGPVGLFLANECARRSLRWRLVEERPAQSQFSKALAVMPRTLEIFDMAGLVDPFVERGNHVSSVAVISQARTLARIHFAPGDSPHPFIAMVPQNVTESLLAEALRRKGGAVEYDTAFVDAEQYDGGVEVTLEKRGERSSQNATYVVGCDGAHSRIRHLLNLPFEGAQYRATFMLADVETNDALPGDEMQLCPNAGGPIAIFPMSATHRRIVAMVDGASGDAPSLDFVRAVAAQRAPQNFEVRALLWSNFFQVHHRQVARMQDGRIFVAGDAAHIHSPFGGQGMNTGLQDAWNLVWKLDLVLGGLGASALLETYSAERRPVVKHMIDTTDFLTKTLGSSSLVAQTARDVVIPIVSQFAAFQHRFVRELSELGVTYEGSPIVDGAGERFVDASLWGGRGIRSRFILFAGAAASAEARRVAEAFPGVVELRDVSSRGLTLVRPDGYVAYRSEEASEAAVRAIEELLDRQTCGAAAPGATA